MSAVIESYTPIPKEIDSLFQNATSEVAGSLIMSGLAIIAARFGQTALVDKHYTPDVGVLFLGISVALTGFSLLYAENARKYVSEIDYNLLAAQKPIVR